jgi:hypothetical protein
MKYFCTLRHVISSFRLSPKSMKYFCTFCCVKGANNIITVRINLLFKMWRWILTVEPWSCPGWRLPPEVRADCSTAWWLAGSIRSCTLML